VRRTYLHLDLSKRAISRMGAKQRKPNAMLPIIYICCNGGTFFLSSFIKTLAPVLFINHKQPRHIVTLSVFQPGDYLQNYFPMHLKCFFASRLYNYYDYQCVIGMFE